MIRLGVRALRLLWGISPRQVLSVSVISLVSALLPAVQVYFTARMVQAVVDAVSRGTGTAPALTAGGCLAGVAVVSHFLAVFQDHQQALLRSRLPEAVGLSVMEKSARLSLRQFEDPDTYDRLQRATRESAFRPLQVFTHLIAVGSAAVSFLSVGAVLLGTSVPVALAICLAPVPAALVSLYFSRRTHAVEHARSEGRRRLTYLEHLLTNDQTYKETRLFGLVPLLLGRSRTLVDEFHATDRRIEHRRALFSALFGLLSAGTTAVAILLAVRSALGTGQVGVLAGYIAGVTLIQASVRGLFASGVQLYENCLFLSHLFAFLDMAEEPSEPDGLPVPTVLRRGIEFQNVSFRYPGDERAVLDGVSFTVPAGACVALVGRNGAGKSTLLKLLTRFYEPTGGRILLDGRPLTHYALSELRDSIGVIFQDYQQYEAPVRENIGFGRVSALDDDQLLWEAAETAGARDILAGLPRGLDAQLGRWFPGGHQLSGGQWQKVALARAVVRRAPIMILDEPTAAIDAAAEAEVFDVLRSVHTRATSLLVAHRFSAVRTADHIVVLDGGRVLEEGSHDELMAADGLYASLFDLQAAGYH
ncbi:ABC transporter ATP-binding protein/permease [Streptomyces sp. NBC_00555]|uniref:ABC transporter ATP-binding protein n=1 Tax=Streptomyces sp. NBC_00555 TaxID=2903662 RepID=UPI0022591B69|nr:ABC transporter ATP-binding protein [Streptomyces sp. NBC_00555]MCX5011919.1 ABC transporter ATP-binding protein/permease [Streptomyces sp. NBC_00555]